MEKINQLTNEYYKAIRQLQFKEDIIAALPQTIYKRDLILLKDTIDILKNDLVVLKEMLNNTSKCTEQEVQEIKEEIEITQFKIEACNELLKKGIEDKIIEEAAEVTPKKNIIFATTESGNVCIENDLKSFPEEYYHEVEESLQQLVDGFIENNAEKGKQLKNCNKLSGVHEIIHFKVRVTYKILSSDTVYVLMAKMKKSTWDARDRKEIIDRASQRSKQYERLKKDIKNPIRKEELIQEHKKILDSLLGHLQQNKR